jgi:OOP family OmpA-OmpF porin
MMKASKIHILIAAIVLSISVEACKTKKIVPKPTPPVQPVTPPSAQPAPASTPPPKEEPAPAPAKPDFNFKNIQFEFNSAVLKTGSYEILDKAAAEIKKDPAAKFVINGHSSAEGTAAHNQSLSEDRANAVKSYLINAGVTSASLTAKGYGESKPITTNTSDESRALNRRVEIKQN